MTGTTAGSAADAEAAFADALARLAAAAHAVPPPVDREAVWRRVEARIAESAAAGRERPITRRWARVAAIAVCVLAFLVWTRSRPASAPQTTGVFPPQVASRTRPSAPSAGLRKVRLDLSLWRSDRIAPEPVGGATGEMIALLDQ